MEIELTTFCWHNSDVDVVDVVDGGDVVDVVDCGDGGDGSDGSDVLQLHWQLWYEARQRQSAKVADAENRFRLSLRQQKMKMPEEWTSRVIVSALEVGDIYALRVLDECGVAHSYCSHAISTDPKSAVSCDRRCTVPS